MEPMPILITKQLRIVNSQGLGIKCRMAEFETIQILSLHNETHY